MGAALESGDAEAVSMDGLIDRLDKGVEMAFELKRLDPLFATREDHQAFCARHSKAVVRRESLSGYRGDCFLGNSSTQANQYQKQAKEKNNSFFHRLHHLHLMLCSKQSSIFIIP